MIYICMIPMVHDFSMTVYCMDQGIDPFGPQWPIGVYRGLITLISHFQQDNHIRS